MAGGVPLRVLRTDYSSNVDPIVALIDEARARRNDQVVMLIPVVVPTRYRVLHRPAPTDRGARAHGTRPHPARSVTGRVATPGCGRGAVTMTGDAPRLGT